MRLRVFLLCSTRGPTYVFNSCATIFSGGSQEVSIKAMPDRAKIWVDGEMAGSGTARMKVKRCKEHVIEVKLEGYRNAKVTSDKGFNMWVIQNLYHVTGIM